MPFEKNPEPKPTKWEVVYEDDECISVWRYNSKITKYETLDLKSTKSNKGALDQKSLNL